MEKMVSECFFRYNGKERRSMSTFPQELLDVLEQLSIFHTQPNSRNDLMIIYNLISKLAVPVSLYDSEYIVALVPEQFTEKFYNEHQVRYFTLLVDASNDDILLGDDDIPQNLQNQLMDKVRQVTSALKRQPPQVQDLVEKSYEVVVCRQKYPNLEKDFLEVFANDLFTTVVKAVNEEEQAPRAVDISRSRKRRSSAMHAALTEVEQSPIREFFAKRQRTTTTSAPKPQRGTTRFVRLPRTFKPMTPPSASPESSPQPPPVARPSLIFNFGASPASPAPSSSSGTSLTPRASDIARFRDDSYNPFDAPTERPTLRIDTRRPSETRVIPNPFATPESQKQPSPKTQLPMATQTTPKAQSWNPFGSQKTTETQTEEPQPAPACPAPLMTYNVQSLPELEMKLSQEMARLRVTRRRLSSPRRRKTRSRKRSKPKRKRSSGKKKTSMRKRSSKKKTKVVPRPRNY